MLPAAHTGVNKKQDMWQYQRVEEKGSFTGSKTLDNGIPACEKLLEIMTLSNQASMRTKKLAAMQSQPSHIEEKHV